MRSYPAQQHTLMCTYVKILEVCIQQHIEGGCSAVLDSLTMNTNSSSRSSRVASYGKLDLSLLDNSIDMAI